MCVYMHICAHESWKWALEPLDLELQVIVSLHVGARNSARIANSSLQPLKCKRNLGHVYTWINTSKWYTQMCL